MDAAGAIFIWTKFEGCTRMLTIPFSQQHNTTSVRLYQRFRALMSLMKLWTFATATSDARQSDSKWPLLAYAPSNLFQRPYLFVWSQLRCGSQDPDKLITRTKTSVRRAKNIRTDKYQNKSYYGRRMWTHVHFTSGRLPGEKWEEECWWSLSGTVPVDIVLKAPGQAGERYCQ